MRLAVVSNQRNAKREALAIVMCRIIPFGSHELKNPTGIMRFFGIAIPGLLQAVIGDTSAKYIRLFQSPLIVFVR